MSKLFHLAIASTSSKPGAVKSNLQQIAGFARRAANDGAQFLLTPEQSACGAGSYPDVLKSAEVAGDGPIYRALAGMAQETGVAICAGFVERGENNLGGDKKFVAQYAVFPDASFVCQRKHLLNFSEAPFAPVAPVRGPFGEQGHGQPEELHFQIFEVDGLRCAITICADAGIENIRAILAARGAQLILLPSAGGGAHEDCVTNEELSTPAGRAKYLRILQTVFFPGQTIIEGIEHKFAWAAVNMVGYDGRDHHHRGHGMIFNALGETLAFFPGQPNLDRQKSTYAHAVIDLEDRIGDLNF